jgi:hypothetical protein
MWHKAPKFAKGQTGVFLLHATPPAATTAARNMRAISPPPANAYIALDPDDYQPPSAAPAVEAMLPGTPARVIARRIFANAAAGKKAAKAAVKKSAVKKAKPKKVAGKRSTKRG